MLTEDQIRATILFKLHKRGNWGQAILLLIISKKDSVKEISESMAQRLQIK
jgi:hypothetical protein